MDGIEQVRLISGNAAKKALPVVTEAVLSFAGLKAPFKITFNSEWTDIGEAGVMVEHSAMPGTVWCLYFEPGDLDDDGQECVGPGAWIVDVMDGTDQDRNFYHTTDDGVVWKRGSDGAIREAHRGDQDTALKALLKEIAVALGISAN